MLMENSTWYILWDLLRLAPICNCTIKCICFSNYTFKKKFVNTIINAKCQYMTLSIQITGWLHNPFLQIGLYKIELTAHLVILVYQ